MLATVRILEGGEVECVRMLVVVKHWSDGVVTQTHGKSRRSWKRGGVLKVHMH
jgi:hypothetical protein